MKRRAFSILLATLAPASAWAQTLPLKPSALPKDGVEGLLVNSTISDSGLAFFLFFLDFWREKPNSDKYTLDISEGGSRRLGYQVQVNFGQSRMFSSGLPNQRDRIRLLSEQAADASYAALIVLSLPFGGVADPDIASDEL